MIRFGSTLTLLIGASLAVAATACSDTIEEPGNGSDDNSAANGASTGNVDNTFDHNTDEISVWDLIERQKVEGPPSFTSHVHSCSKVRYANLANVLSNVGVDINSNTQFSAGALYQAAASAEGVANYANRIRENIGITTSGASAMFDVFAAAAPEVEAKLHTLARCQQNGVAIAPLFDPTTNACNIDAITCLIGVPATPAHVSLCNSAVSKGSTPDIGKGIAVAALLAAAYTCE
ncbi:MAG TPA: hypothetical protein VFP84_01600 [Kofleriaceae bacterium]|nr:hypothetical protein [Kofleriaceae bacterium]